MEREQVNKSKFKVFRKKPIDAENSKSPISRLPTQSMFPLIDVRDYCGGSKHTTCANLNLPIIKAFEDLIKKTEKLIAVAPKEEKKKHQFRLKSFRQAHNAIVEFPDVIHSGKDLKDIPGIGPGTMKRVDEIIASGVLEELEETADPMADVVMDLCKLSGIGEVKAKMLIVKYDLTSLDDLRARWQKGEIKVGKNQLTRHMAVALEYFDDLQQRIPWSEVRQIHELVAELVHEIDPDLRLEVCGSYRRKRPTCGDIDILLTHPSFKDDAEGQENMKAYLSNIVNGLTAMEFLVAHLTDRGTHKYMGICQLTPKHRARRIDILCIPQSSYGAALLYFTGSGKFNQVMRNLANKRGFTLNEHGLYTFLNRVKGDLIETDSERQIFEILNFKYVTPEEREC